MLSVLGICTSIGRGKLVRILPGGDSLHDGPDPAVGHSDKGWVRERRIMQTSTIVEMVMITYSPFYTTVHSIVKVHLRMIFGMRALGCASATWGLEILLIK